jgi:hypothetical protein
VAIATAAKDVRRRLAAAHCVQPAVAIKTRIAVVAPTLNVSVDTGLGNKK